MAVQQDAAWLQKTGRTTNKKVKHTDSMVETLTCNPLYTSIAGYGKRVISFKMTKFHQAQHSESK